MTSIDINALKRISQQTSNVISESDNKKNYNDDRFWKLERDPKTGNGAAVIRFLPAVKANELPWVTTYSYFLENKANGRWYVEKSRRTIDDKDPMREFISKKWAAAKSDIEKDALRQNFKERMQYICNILVIKDLRNPANNGKVFLYSFGSKIMDKIRAKTDSQFDDKCNIFDWVGGANFMLQAKKTDKFVNYDSSYFDAPSTLPDDKILAAANAMYDLSEFVNPANFKSYEELKAKMESVYGTTDSVEGVPFESPVREVAPTTMARSTVAPTTTSEPSLSDTPWDTQDAPFTESSTDPDSGLSPEMQSILNGIDGVDAIDKL